MGKPADIEHDLGVLHRAVVTAFPGQQTFDADLSRPSFIRPVLTISCDEAFAVVLMHGRIDTELRVGCGSDQINPEAIHDDVGGSMC